MNDKKSTKKPFTFEFTPNHKPLILITITAPTPPDISPYHSPENVPHSIPPNLQPRQRSTSRPKKSTNSSSSNFQHQQNHGWNNDTEIVVVEDRDDKLFAKTSSTKTNHRKHSTSSSSEHSSSTLSHRPPFNLDTHIDGYDDVDENGKYRKKASEVAIKAERKKSSIQQQELNQQWAESLRDNFYH